MIYPDQVKPPGTKPDRYDLDMLELEQRCDEAIKYADTVCLWPARVKQLRMQICDEAVTDTMIKYRDAGWRVSAGLDGCYFTIDRPLPQS